MKQFFFLVAIISILSFLLPLQVYSQENGDGDEISILEQTLGLDIQTASYYELIAWCEVLGLPQRGTRRDLQRRLYSFYGIPPEAEVEEEQAGRIVTITSAAATEYFTLDQVDENYIVLESNVVLEMIDNERQSVHNIKADRILFNQTKNLITATGNVEYILEEQDSTDFFTGESLTFNIDTWEGVFFSGVSETERTIEEEAVTFYYSGETIHRSEKDIITLTNGTVTSSKGSKPNYRIKARKIWVLAPGEWAFLSASMYIGHIPVFYLPFFFRAGDTLFFHPSIGVREKEGFFIQTTTYLLGEKEEDESTISFLQIGEEGGELYEKKIRGLYLRKTDPLSPEEEEKQKKITESGTYIKIIADLYSRLGVYGGFAGNLSNFGILNQFQFLTTIAESRNIYKGESGFSAYTYLWDNGAGEYESTWHKSFIGNAFVPFRYGLSTLLRLNHSIFTLNGDFEFYSDPYYLPHFSEREEKVNWSSLVGLESGDDTVTTTDDISTQDTLKWSASGTLTPPIQKLQPYVSSMKLTNLSTSLDWRSKDIDTTTTAYTDLTTLVPEVSWTEFTFPEQKFYYPSNYILPDVSFSFSGTLVSYPWKAKAEKVESEGGEEEEEKPAYEIAPPWEVEDSKDTAKSDQDAEDELLRIPETMKELPLSAPVTLTPFKMDLSYLLTPKATVSTQIETVPWLTREDIDFSNSFSLFNAYGTGSLTANARILENFIVLTDSLSIAYDFREHFNNRALNDAEWLEKRQQVYAQSSLKLQNNIKFVTSPFFSIEALKTSSITYTLNTTLLQYTFDSLANSDAEPIFVTETARWDTDFVTGHSLNTIIAGMMWNDPQSVQLNVILPPLDSELSSILTIVTGPLKSLFSWGLEQQPSVPADPDSAKIWAWKPHEISETLDIGTIGTFTQYFAYDVEKRAWNTSKTTLGLSFLEDNITFKEDFVFGGSTYPESLTESWNLFRNPTSSTTTLKLYWLTASFTARKTLPYTFNLAQRKWELVGTTTDDEEFIPEKFTGTLNYQSNFDPFWKNRIAIKTNFSASVDLNLIRFTESALSLSLDVSLLIHEFLNINFSAQSENKQPYRYFAGPSEKVGFALPINPVTDIVNSFSFFDEDKRRNTLFNAKKVSVDITHHLGDWDLSLEYAGIPELVTIGPTSSIKEYKWDRTFTILVKWNPIPEIKKDLTISTDLTNDQLELIF